VEIRTPRDEDLPELLRIYNHYVVTSHVTFDIEPPSLEERRSWLQQFAPDGPHRLVVGQVGGHPVGYASSSRFRVKAAYASSVETTVYIDSDHLGLGLGLALYGALLEQLVAEPSAHRGYGCIALPNPGSVALHERLGFVRAGIFHEVGHKSGEYWDVAWYEKDLSLAG
jgi:phosphinothricin acetyltransferase